MTVAMKPATKVVAYFRLTPGRPRDRQRRQQRSLIKEFVEANDLEVVKNFTDTQDHWPKLDEAIAYCQEHGAPLILANAGRLTTSRQFTERLAGTGIEFAAAGDRHFNSKTIGILAAIAEEEAIKKSQKSKEALAEAKRRGVKLGSNRPGHWEGREHRRGFLQGSAEAARLRTQRTQDYYAFVTPRIVQLREQGFSFMDIARKLNEEGFKTQVGGDYLDTTVMRVLRRHEKATGKKVAKGVRT